MFIASKEVVSVSASVSGLPSVDDDMHFDSLIKMFLSPLALDHPLTLTLDPALATSSLP
jgi:hypothetical protein